MKIRAAGLSDLPAIMEIINEARRNLKEQGIVLLFLGAGELGVPDSISVESDGDPVG